MENANKLMCRPPIGLAASVNLNASATNDRSADGGGRTIDCAGKPKRPWQQRNRQQQYAVDEDLPRGFGPAGSRPAAWGHRHGHYSSARLSDSAQK